MKKSNYLILFVLFTVFSLGSSRPIANNPSEIISETPPITIALEESLVSSRENNDPIPPVDEPTRSNIVPEITATPSDVQTNGIFSTLDGCEMEISVLSGPLAEENTNFSVLGKDYFLDKGDKFGFGKGTGILYEAQRYFILHSSYALAGNRPLEAEFFRKYLEKWADNIGPEYIQEQIDALIGSEVNWLCDGKLVFTTQINGVARLSHQASDRLWLEPEQLEEIVKTKEGLLSEWVGEIPESNNPNLFLAFCGWGPKSMGVERYTYYRYLISFELIES